MQKKLQFVTFLYTKTDYEVRNAIFRRQAWIVCLWSPRVQSNFFSHFFSGAYEARISDFLTFFKVPYRFHTFIDVIFIINKESIFLLGGILGKSLIPH